MSKDKPVEAVITVRDIEQSTRSTQTSAKEITTAYAHYHEYGADGAQTTGGTFFDLPARIGRDPYQFNRDVCDHFSGTTQYALIRGEFGISPNIRQSLDSLTAQIDFLASCGVNRLQNFNASNTIQMMRGVPMAANRLAEEKGYDLYAMGSLCIQENPNTKGREQKILDDLYKVADQLIETGHHDFYLKNANGILRPEFVYQLVEGLNERFDEETHFHTHATYGYAYDTMLAAIEAGITRVDVAPDALGDSTGQPAIGKLCYAMEHSSNDALTRRLPQNLSMEAMAKDHDAMIKMRGLHSHRELPFNRRVLAAHEPAGSAGGALTSLSTLPTWEALVEKAGADGEIGAIIAIGEAKAKNREALGYPTNVTPTENMQDVQASANALGNKMLQPLTIKYLTGQLGDVSETADPELVEEALQWTQGVAPEIQPIEELPDALPEAGKKIIRDSRNEFAMSTDEEALIVATLGENGLNHVMEKRQGTLSEPKKPQLPLSLGMRRELVDAVPTVFSIAYDLLERHKLETGFYKGMEHVQDDLVELFTNDIENQTQALVDLLDAHDNDPALSRIVSKTVVALAKDIGVPSSDLSDVRNTLTVRGEASPSRFANERSWSDGPAADADVGEHPGLSHDG
ncbi:MAG: hypothetical protein ACRBDL_01200 [Alphaproteobacteria bacterium]